MKRYIVGPIGGTVWRQPSAKWRIEVMEENEKWGIYLALLRFCLKILYIYIFFTRAHGN